MRKSRGTETRFGVWPALPWLGKGQSNRHTLLGLPRSALGRQGAEKNKNGFGRQGGEEQKHGCAIWPARGRMTEIRFGIWPASSGAGNGQKNRNRGLGLAFPVLGRQAAGEQKHGAGPALPCAGQASGRGIETWFWVWPALPWAGKGQNSRNSVLGLACPVLSCLGQARGMGKETPFWGLPCPALGRQGAEGQKHCFGCGFPCPWQCRVTETRF